MTRKELYKEITSLNLQEQVIFNYGRNYTQCTNEQLSAIVRDVHKNMPTEVSSSSFQKLVDILAKKKILLKSEIEYIMGK